MTSGRRPVVALVSDAIYPYFRGGKEFRYHEAVGTTRPTGRCPRLHDEMVGRPVRTP